MEKCSRGCACRWLIIVCWHALWYSLCGLVGYYGSGLIRDGIETSHHPYQATTCKTTSADLSDIGGERCLQLSVRVKEDPGFGGRYTMSMKSHFLMYNSFVENEHNCMVDPHKKHLLDTMLQQYGKQDTYYTCYTKSNSDEVILRHSPIYKKIGHLVGGVVMYLVLFALFCYCCCHSHCRKKRIGPNGQRVVKQMDNREDKEQMIVNRLDDTEKEEEGGERGQTIMNRMDNGEETGEKQQGIVNGLDDDEKHRETGKEGQVIVNGLDTEEGDKETGEKGQKIINGLDFGDEQKEKEKNGQVIVNGLDAEEGEKEKGEKGQVILNGLDYGDGQKEAGQKGQEQTNVQEINEKDQSIIVKKDLTKLMKKIMGMIPGVGMDKVNDTEALIGKPELAGEERDGGLSEEGTGEKRLEQWI